MACDISIVIPLYDEEENTLPLVREIKAAMARLPQSFEIVLVDDASKDGTWSKIQEARKLHPEVRGLRHTKNAGQSAALWTGLQASRGEILVTLDGDLQNDPADIPLLVAEVVKYDFVCGVRTKRKDDFIRRASSKVARRARKLVLGVDFADTGCAFRAFKRSVLPALFAFNGLHRFMPVLVHSAGASTLEIPINHRARVAGVSKYGMWNRLGRGIFDLFAIAWYQRRRVGGTPFEELND